MCKIPQSGAVLKKGVLKGHSQDAPCPVHPFLLRLQASPPGNQPFLSLCFSQDAGSEASNMERIYC